MVSVVDVARHAGVSQATVSRVLSGKIVVAEPTRQRVMAAVAALGYQPSLLGKALRSGQSDTVAFLVSDIEQSWYAALAKQLQNDLEAAGCNMLLFDLGHSQERLVQVLRQCQSLHVRGIVLSSTDPLDVTALQPEVENLHRRRIRLISTAQDLCSLGFASVLHDEEQAGAQAVGYLLARGRRRIAYLNRIQNSMMGQRRYQAYCNALRHHGVTLDPDLIWSNPQFRFEGGFATTLAALQRGLQFDAILAGTDELATGAIAAITDAGLRIPEDVAVLGIGGLTMSAYIRPALTTLSGEAAAISRHVVAQLGRTEAEMVLVQRHLERRASA